MEEQFGSKEGELSIVHEGYKGGIVGKKTCGGILEDPLG
jgi:hypothetical protein